MTKKAVSVRGLQRGGHKNHHPAMALITKLREVQYTSVVNLVSMTRVATQVSRGAVHLSGQPGLHDQGRHSKFPEVQYTSVVNLASMTRVATQVSRGALHLSGQPGLHDQGRHPSVQRCSTPQ
ncbi:hypothetical protein RRG08_037813 [Elysia crispata]|uniref:Uncharacterized protein n=1 Tax=Elysia crispata TaxID=231223 RepID=A0AAE1BCQ9_9GAST|nr:hypothetical protein RRG08_037813 [Elysia crispata]